jgi:beta-galactosidase
MAHILPHWTWPERIGQVTPVHVFSAADEAELFVNGKSAGKIKKAASTYRFRWDASLATSPWSRIKTEPSGLSTLNEQSVTLQSLTSRLIGPRLRLMAMIYLSSLLQL